MLPWNEFVMLPKGRAAAEHLHGRLGAGCRKAGRSLARSRSTRSGTERIGFEEANLARLIDSPVQMGEYLERVELSGSAPYPQLRHSISIAADSAAALVLPQDFAADYSRLVAQAGMLFGTRMYRHYTWLLTLSDHVAHFGLEHHESSDDRTLREHVLGRAAARGARGAAGARVRA